MKILILAVTIMLSSSFAFASTPPEAVKKAFEKKFPAVTKVKWGKENSKTWEAEFNMNSTKVSANFSSDGTWEETESEIPTAQLPSAVTASIEKNYPKWKISGAAKIETSTNGVHYEADLISGKKKKEVVYKEDGSAVK